MTISELVKKELSMQPELLQALELGIANNSAIARLLLPKIRKLDSSANFQSVMAAIRRYSEQLKPRNVSKIKKLLKSSKVRMRSKVADLTMVSSPGSFAALKNVSSKINLERGELFHVIQGSSAISVIIDQDKLTKIEPIIKKYLFKLRKNLTEITLISPEGIEDTPGVVSHLTSIISRNNINLIEHFSCYTDTIFIVSDDQATKTYDVLNNLVKS